MTKVWTILAALALLAGAATTRFSAAADPAAPATPPTLEALAKMVQAEVERQLPDRVAQEVARQLAALIKQARHESSLHSAASTLQTVRSQLELYKLQHNDTYPTLADLANWDAFVHQTNAAGKAVLQGGFGPYLQRAPVCPFTEQSQVVAPQAATAQAGWTYNEKTGELRVIVRQGDLPADQRILGPNDVTVLKAPAPTTRPR